MKKGKIYLLSMLLLGGVATAGAQPQAESDWIKAAVNAKQSFLTEIHSSRMPVVSEWMKLGHKPARLSADLTGKQELILVTDGGPDGSSYDHAAWINARLYKADGSFVWLDDLKYAVGRAGWRTPMSNRNVAGKHISVAGKTYDHAVFCHAPGYLLYRLDGKYTRFETEVGIDDGGKTSSVYFKILTSDPDRYLGRAFEACPSGKQELERLVGNAGDWMLDPAATLESKRIEQLLAKIEQPDYYRSRWAEVERMSAAVSRDTRALLLLREMNEVLDVQRQLAGLRMEPVRAAFEDMKKNPDYDLKKYAPQMQQLESLVKKGFAGIYKGDARALADARKAISLRRSVLLGNALLDGDRIVATRYRLGAGARSAMAPQLGTQSNNWSNQESARRGGFDASIVEISNLRGDVKLRDIYRPANGSSIADLRLHWDGRRVMFTQLQDDRRWNVFEVGLDGSGYKKLIDNEEPDLEFYDGTYLPDGRLLAVSNIGYQGVPCVNGSDAVGNLVLYDPASKNLRRLCFDQDANWNPVVMNNGRVMYTRWEYTDLTHYYSRIVMHMNPDGTENKALYGSGSMFPNSTFDIQPIPGMGSAFVGIISGHHGVARSGRLLLFDPAKGRKGVHGVLQEIPYHDRPVKEVIKDRLVDGVWPQFIKPTAVSDKYFLVAAKLSPESLWGIYLVDVFDNMTCIAEMEGEGFISPALVRQVPTPPAIPDRVKLDEKEATFFIQDIYEGEGLRGIPRGTVKELRLHAYEYAYVKTISDHNWHGIQSGWDIKRLLGTVPVEPDGSVIFKAPANTPISIQPIDKDGVAVQWMRSWVTGQPGEVVSCVGCHEDQNEIPIPKRVMASKKAPSRLTPPEGGVRSFTFDLEIQPILDRACIACHDGGKAFDLRGGKKDRYGYGTSYLNFHPYIHRQGGEGDMVVLQPYEYHPNTSELVRILKRGHYNVQLTDKEWRTLYNWIDYNAPDKGYFKANVLHDLPYKGYDQIARRKELTDKYANGAGVDWKKELSDYAEKLRQQGKPEPVMPKPLKKVKRRDLKAKNWPFSAEEARRRQQECGADRKVVELAPGVQMTFVRIPAGEFVMGSYDGPADTYPTARVKIDRPFWMAELETTNEQFQVFYSEHDSRYVDQQWKDHVVQGYPANRPEQPVIRVSYTDAMEFCRKLSEKTGLKVTLPTEAQWEWACRGGSASDFWYGDLHADFGKKDNLADKTTLLFAVAGVDPQPMSPNHPLYKHYTYLPKEESVDDGQLVQVGGKAYAANPFGLYCMHGNVAEWTRSDYVPYPYREKPKAEAEYKVVRGGSYIERPKFSTSYSRKGFYPYQRVFNVGFRVIIEE